jgi:hypothetical protein
MGRSDFSSGLNAGCGFLAAIIIFTILGCAGLVAMTPGTSLNREVLIFLHGHNAVESNDRNFKPAAPPQGPTESDFVLEFEAIGRDYGLYAVGTVQNNGSEPAYVVLEINAKDKDKKLIESRRMYPASTENIAPGETVAFDVLASRSDTAEFVSVRIAEVDQWRR